MKKNKDSFFENTMYHLFSRTNNKEPLFKTDENRRFFLQRYKELLFPFVKTYAYTLQSNHFHFLISIRKQGVILKHLKNLHEGELKKQKLIYSEHPLEEMLDLLISSTFHRLFTSYSKAYNRMYERQGGLFNRPFARKRVENQNHFTHLIYYLHANCRKHKVQFDFEYYKWSSFQTILSEKKTLLEREFVLNWFGGIEPFLEFHRSNHDESEIADLLLE